MAPLCKICKQECEVIVSAYRKQPFVDGKFYDIICFKCSSVPKWIKQENDEWVDAYREIYTIDELKEFGWTQEEMLASHKAVSRLLRNSDYHNIKIIILDKLFLNVNIS